ncbi:hypothetical protein QGM61_06030 [Pseudohongiella sp. SYSU M77423]|uniref:DAPG hydrolase family protein n=1 Tax=Pseudohongiella sp. SYSU M77423 TaxID=3042312 RepID=UPI00248131F5|nr:hypothetical protein [Pseudohongiella sp. SYSU M77423]MDH7943372.1 hypothetical protein [Pseudohongiella sp. SYSU M77423]
MWLRRQFRNLDPRPSPWPMKTLKSATTSFRKSRNGVLELTIQHDILLGVTPAMLAWWFHHLGETMSFRGDTYARYLVWHPIDHIHWQLLVTGPDGCTGQGATFRIVEAFGGQLDHYIDSIEFVEKCDDQGLTLVKRVMGLEVFRLEHRFIPMSDGTRYASRMVVGSCTPILGWLINYLIRPAVFSDATARAWLLHNIEEVGNFEIFLPELFAASMVDQQNTTQSP